MTCSTTLASITFCPIRVGRSCRIMRSTVLASQSSSSSSASMADVDDETELVDGTLLDDDGTVFAPMDDTAVAAKAAAAYRRYKRLVGLNGETCYVLITDRLSGVWKISIRRDEQPPLDFFKEFIATHGSSAAGRRVRFDGGGELGGCTDVHDLFAKAGYSVEITAPDSSSEIGQVERPHRALLPTVFVQCFLLLDFPSSTGPTLFDTLSSSPTVCPVATVLKLPSPCVHWPSRQREPPPHFWVPHLRAPFFRP